MDWVRISKLYLPPNPKTCDMKFFMPLDYSVEVEHNLVNGSLCKDAILTVLGMGIFSWEKVLKLQKHNLPLPRHWLEGKPSNNLFKEGSPEKN